jgi:Abnormal spindle-like microcephaly-assoc'd, ASPM-SPD-2-Hydin
MVGKRFCNCLNWKSLFKAFLFVSTFSLLTIQTTNSRAATSGAATVATAPAATPPVFMEVTPEAVSFVNVPVGDTYTQAVRLTNLAAGTLQIKKITTSSNAFRITGILLPVVVAHGTSQSFTVAFRGKAEGQTDGQVSIFTTSNDPPLVLKVRASTATSQSELTASDAGIDFEDVAVGNSGKKEVLLTNSGNRDVRISGISPAGRDFSLSGATAVDLSPGQNVSLEVNFAPRSAGRQTGSLTVTSAEGGPLLTIPLTATGAPPSQSAVKLNWEESPVSVAGYVVYRSAESAGPYVRISESVPSAEYVDTGLAAGHTYYYVVSSLDADRVESEYSPQISATVPKG